MRIAQLISIEATNGAARHALALSEELVRRGHQVTLFHRHWLDVEAARQAGVDCVEITYAFTRASLSALRAELRRREIELVHAHTSKAHAVAMALRLTGGPPVVATAHAQHLQLPWALTDLVIAPATGAAAFHRRVNRVSPRRMRVIPTFIGAQTFGPPTRQRRAAARLKLGVGKGAFVVGQVADIHFDKRQSDLAAAGARLRAQGLDVVIALKGAAVNAVEMRRLARAGRALGPALIHDLDRGDVGMFLDALDLFALTSDREVGPLSALEALSAGLPLVATDVGRVSEMIGDGAAGRVVRRRDIAGLAGAIARLASDDPLRARMARAAPARAAALRDDAAAFDAIEAALAEAAAVPWAGAISLGSRR